MSKEFIDPMTDALQVRAALILMAQTLDNHAAQLARHEDLIRQLQERIENLERLRRNRR